VTLLQAAPAAAVASRRLARRLGATTSVGADSVALTFDDGPHPEGTRRVVEVLAELDAPATFFLSGEQVVRFPQVASEIAARGHALGAHGYRHVLLSVRGPRGTAADLSRAVRVIEQATGVRPRHYRPPYGVLTPAAVVAARRSDLQTVLWTRWVRDWARHATPASVVRRATHGLHGGEVILLHDADHYGTRGAWRATAAALPAIVEAARTRGLRLVALA
jgi:peptidoglycan/xylan/chitin deacetylase (PgdA/CDA1 family)